MPGDPADDSHSFTSSHIGDKVENSSRPQAKTGPGLRPGAIQPRRLARPGGTWSRSAERETPPFIFAWAKMNLTKNKPRGRSRATPLRPKAAHANQPAGLVFPSPALSALSPFRLPQSGRRSWNPFPGNGFPFPIVSALPPFRLSQSGERTTGKTVPEDGLSMSALCARSISLAAASDYFSVWVETRVGHRVSKGSSVSCGTRLRALP